MCDFCRMTHCPPPCPAYDGHRGSSCAAEARCRLCGSPLDRGEQVLEKQGSYLCASCADELDLDGLLYLTDTDDVRALLHECLGWELSVL